MENASGTVKVLVWEGYEDPNAFAELDDITIEAGYLAVPSIYSIRPSDQRTLQELSVRLRIGLSN